MNKQLLCTRRRKHRNTIVTDCRFSRIMSTLSSVILILLVLVLLVMRTDGSSSTTTNKPNSIVSIIIKSPIGTPKLLEQFIELPIVASNRNIHSIKQSIQRQWLQISSSSSSSSTSSGQQIKPPLSIIHISYKGQLITNNDMTIQEILEDDDDEDDEEDNDNDSNDNIGIGDDDQKTIVFTLEMIPPIDSKNFYTELESKVNNNNNNNNNDIPVSASDVLDAFCYNEAAIQYLYSQQTSTTLTLTTPSTDNSIPNTIYGIDDNDNVKTNLGDNIVPSGITNLNRKVILSKLLQNRAQQIKDEYMNTLFRSDTTKKLLTKKKKQPSTSTSSSSTGTSNGVSRSGPAGITSSDTSNTIVRRGDRIRYVNSNSDVSSSSTSTSSSRIIQLRQILQKQFNINWIMSIRHSLLFLFFGLFGGRTPITRTLLLSGSPAVFILQSRFIKYYIKRILYFIFCNPPGIILTLLPSPYQAILSYSYTKSMNDLYGNLLPGQPLSSSLTREGTNSGNSNVRNNNIKQQQQQQKIKTSTKASPIKMKLVQQQRQEQEQERAAKTTIKDEIDDEENDVDEDEESMVDDEEEEQEDVDVDDDDDDVDIDMDIDDDEDDD